MNADNLQSALGLARKLQEAAPKEWIPPSEGCPPKSEMVVFHALVKNSRAYIEKIVYQINGCYENGWYDSCAVMIRRLLETLIIEAFEAHSIAQKIKNPQGDFLYLRDLISIALSEPSWNLGRNTKRALPKLKDIGDKSAHNRRFIAVRGDIDEIRHDLRTAVQELMLLSKLK
ncbi:hypothetical protein [Paludisphaera borealis]|uniref:hypothetical protein n=1 Tax=Paludisphaera borealis TaxID=1387353 RepID=UPI000971221F|nr:hypothetical protein [Paludisphaera borealis]